MEIYLPNTLNYKMRCGSTKAIKEHGKHTDTSIYSPTGAEGDQPATLWGWGQGEPMFEFFLSITVAL